MRLGTDSSHWRNIIEIKCYNLIPIHTKIHTRDDVDENGIDKEALSFIFEPMCFLIHCFHLCKFVDISALQKQGGRKFQHNSLSFEYLGQVKGNNHAPLKRRTEGMPSSRLSRIVVNWIFWDRFLRNQQWALGLLTMSSDLCSRNDCLCCRSNARAMVSSICNSRPQ